MKDIKSNNNKENKLRILTFVPYYLPGFKGGGPIRTIENMVNRLKDFSFLVVTSDRDLGDKNSYDSIKPDSWNMVNGNQVFYAGSKFQTWGGMWDVIKNTSYDFIYFNSFFNFEFSIRPLIICLILGIDRKKIIVSPRGEFSPGALSLKSGKKQFFIFFSKLVKLHKGIKWHASTEKEVDQILKLYGSRNPYLFKNYLICAPDLLPEIAPKLNPHVDLRCETNVLKICFLSRISPMKNLLFSLELLAEVKAPINFSIYGPIESDSYWLACLATIKRLPSHISVEYYGALNHSDVHATLKKFDIFFMPSLGENFGHVFIEALSSGLPILISDQTPWTSLQDKGIGWDIPLDRPLDFISALEWYANLNFSQRQQMRERCINFSLNYLNNPENLELNKALFLKS